MRMASRIAFLCAVVRASYLYFFLVPNGSLVKVNTVWRGRLGQDVAPAQARWQAVHRIVHADHSPICRCQRRRVQGLRGTLIALH